MKEIEIHTFAELHDVIEKYDARTVVYRGMKSVPNKITGALKKTINKYGIDRFSLFPSLESLAVHIEWLQSKGY